MNSKFFRTFSAIAVALLLAACTQDELTGDGTQLLEGKYPLEIASVSLSAEVSDEPWGATPAPQTRVAESADGGSSHWTDGDEIGIKIGEDGTPGRYRVDVDGTGSVTGVTALDAAYWTSTAQAAVSAWYPTAETVSLADQSDKLAYVLQGSGTGTYNAAVTLDFTHSLAKVRVIPSGSDAGKVTGIMIKTYTSCTHTNGAEIKGSNEGWITMKESTYDNTKCWEANVVPGQRIEKFQINGTAEGTLTTFLTPQAAKVNTITLTVGKRLLQPGSDGKFTIKGGDDVLIKDYNGTAPIVVNGNATLTLENVNINLNQTQTAAITVGQNAHLMLNVTGASNKLTSKDWGGILLNSNASIEIVGTSRDASRLEVTAGDYEETGASVAGIGAASGVTCGDITIRNVSIKVSGGSSWKGTEGGAAIGTSTRNSACGNIIITNSHIEATGGPAAAAIGLGYTYSRGKTLTVKNIEIDNSVIDATIKSFDSLYSYGACIGLCSAEIDGVTLNCGTITIKNAAADFLDKLKYEGTDTNKGYKIGKGHGSNATINFSGGTFNGTSFTDGYGNW